VTIEANMELPRGRDSHITTAPNALITSQKPHHQELEILAAEALARRDFVAAFKFADRRCRIEPAALAHCYVQRAEAAYNLGEKPAALADLRTALEISPHDVAGTRRSFSWASGPDRTSAALNLIAHDQDIGVLRAAIEALARVEQRRLAAVSVFDEAVTGWAVWDLDEAVELTIASEDGVITALLDPDPFYPLSSRSARATAFRLSRPASRAPQMLSISLHGKSFFAQRMAPNSREIALPKLMPAKQSVSQRLQPTIIVPVYADFKATEACLDSVTANSRSGKSYRILIVNDATPEPAISKYLQVLAKRADVEVLTNPVNLGFVGSINRALSRLTAGDVVLLNADTVVPPGFLDRLQATARRSDDIGTVVPLSNNGGITDFPIPFANNPLGSRDDVIRLDRIAAKCNKDVAIDLPNGTGFCLYVTRACLNAVGGLSESFQRGYLEDIDFCLRAREQGFRNVCAASVYVGHAGSRSFKTEKRSLVLHNLGVLDRRFPHFRTECAAFIAADPLRPFREKIERLLPSPKSHPVLVLMGTGALRDNAKARAQQLLAEKRFAIVLETVSQNGQKRLRFSAADHAAPQSLSFGLSTPAELRDLRSYLDKLSPSHCEVIEPTGLPPTLIKLFAEKQIPFDLWITDGTLIASLDTSGRRKNAIGVPKEISTINSPALTNGTNLRTVLSAARRILVPSESAKAFTTHALPGRETQLLKQPVHGLSLPSRRQWPRGAPTLAIVPTRSSVREFSVIRSLALLIKNRRSDTAILVAGATFDDLRLMSHENIFVTGPMEASELGSVLQPHNIGWMLTGFDGPLFGHPVIESVRSADVAVAYVDWSMGTIRPRAGDLAIDPDVSPDVLAHQVVSWIERA
jgi:O-antigen biosynthesis protein